MSTSGLTAMPLIAAGSIDVDATALVVAVIFLGLMAFLKGMLFDPYLKLVEERQRRTTGATDLASGLRSEAESLQKELERRQIEARDAATAAREALRTEGRAQESQILADARGRAEQKLTEGAAKLSSEVKTVEVALEARARSLADVIVGRLGARA
jgi:F0F1-type ATP synthase membrane subunit b/b'